MKKMLKLLYFLVRFLFRGLEGNEGGEEADDSRLAVVAFMAAAADCLETECCDHCAGIFELETVGAMASEWIIRA